MEKVERQYVEVGVEMIEGTKKTMKLSFQQILKNIEEWIVQKDILIILIGFLLGRALILAHLTPFALPFFAVIYTFKKNKAPFVLLSVLAGSITLSIGTTINTFVSSTLFLISFRVLRKFHRNPVKALPYYVLVSAFISKAAYLYIQQQENFSMYDGLMTGVESILTFILTLIFMQCIPIISPRKRKKSLRIEEVVSLIIMLASVLTGTIGWKLYDLSVEHILSRYLVLLLSFVGGATVGSTVGVVTGLIFSLANVSSFYNMSLLAFSGLLGGLLREGKRIGTAFGLLISTFLIGMYGSESGSLFTSFNESLVAIILLFLTPKTIRLQMSKLIPGTNEYAQEQQQYMHKLRNITVDRVEQFSSVFQALSNSFSQYDLWRENDNEEKQFDYFLSNVTEKSCQNCFKKEKCWARNFHQTYDTMKDLINEMENTDGKTTPRTHRQLESFCVNATKVEHAVAKELSLRQANEKLKQQVKESRKLVAEQLLGVSSVMEDFANEMKKERVNHQKQEDMILEAVREFGLEIEQVEVYSVEQGNVDIEMAISFDNEHGECEKIIAPLLSDILGETIMVQKEQLVDGPGGYAYITFRSAKAYVVETGVAHAAKDGGFISGDSFSMIELGARKYAVAISDGMGNGERAHQESNETLKLLQKILKSGIEEEIAIKSVNSILSLRTTEEIFSTLDLAMIDLQDAHVKFLKIGSTPSFIKRRNQVIKVESTNLPMGVLQEFEVDVVSDQLKAEDLLIMMSDGIFEGPKHVENYEVWMKRKIREIETTDPQEIADLIMEEVIRTSSGEITDDMTIVVTKLKHNIPKWAPISVNNMLIS